MSDKPAYKEPLSQALRRYPYGSKVESEPGVGSTFKFTLHGGPRRRG